MPADVPRLSRDQANGTIKSALLSMRQWMSDIEDRQPAIQIWFIDACRQDPFVQNGRPFANSGGMGQIPTKPKSLVISSANYGQVALDRLPTDPPNVASPFSRTVAADFDAWKNQNVLMFVKRVQEDVIKLVYPDPQLPVYEDATIGTWCFVQCSDSVGTHITTAPTTTSPEPYSPPSNNPTPSYASFADRYARGYREHTWHVIVASPSSERDAKRVAANFNRNYPNLYFQEIQSNPDKWMVTLGSGIGKADADRLLPVARAVVPGSYEYCWGVGPTDPRGECER